jgi:hypothetical protein
MRLEAQQQLLEIIRRIFSGYSQSAAITERWERW